MSTNDGASGVSNCYVFKSRLQEYAQKANLSTPVYETIREGPSHEPFFRSTVIVNNARYDSLPGFTSRKASEQSAAEVALVELAKSGQMDQSVSQPVHETGLCKNLLQEYAQKMNYAIPSYECQKDEKPGRVPFFSCTVQIGGIQYIGAVAKTKKEAEIKAARTALLAIRSSGGGSSEKPDGNPQLTVIPCKRKGTESGSNGDQIVKAPKPKKTRFKKRWVNKKLLQTNVSAGENPGFAQTQSGVEQSYPYGIQGMDSGALAVQTVGNLQHERANTNQTGTETYAAGGASVPNTDGYLQNGQLMGPNLNQGVHMNPNSVIPGMFQVEYLASLIKQANTGSGFAKAAPNATVDQREASCFMAGSNQTAN